MLDVSAIKGIMVETVHAIRLATVACMFASMQASGDGRLHICKHASKRSHIQDADRCVKSALIGFLSVFVSFKHAHNDGRPDQLCGLRSHGVQ